MSTAADKLLPPLKVDDLFHHKRGRVGRIMTGKEKAYGIATGKSEVVIKFDKASSGIRTSGHMMAALEYQSRNGQKELIDENGQPVSYEEARELVQQWCEDQEVPEQEDKKRPADARRCIVSCPPGTDPQKFTAAASEWGQEIFGEEGYQFLMAVHWRDKDHPKEPEHPHAHFLIKAVNDEGKRLNVRKADLRYMRERFAVIAREHGIELNATPRAVRGRTQRAKTQAKIHQESRRQEQTQAQKWAIDRKKKELAAKQQKMHPYEKARRDELAEHIKSGKDITDHPVLERAKRTRQKVQENAAAYIKELRESGNAEDAKLAEALEKKFAKLERVESAQQKKLRIARRIVAERQQAERAAQGKDIKTQSQAQKWAIDRKKKQQNNQQER